MNVTNSTSSQKTEDNAALNNASPNTAKPPRKVSIRSAVLLAVVGIAVIGGSLWYRHRIMSTPQYRLQAALLDPRVRGLESQIERLQSAINASPADVKPRWQLADLYQKIGSLDLAGEQLEAITKIQPDSIDAVNALASVHLAMFRPELAEPLYQQMIAKWPKRAEGWQGLATTLFQRGRYFESIATIRKAVLLEPNNPNHRLILASTLIQYAGQFPSSETYAPYAFAAQKELQKLLPVWPSPGDIHYLLGNTCVLLKDNKGAIRHFQEAIQRLPERLDIYASLAQIQMASGDNAAARVTVEKGLAHANAPAQLYDMKGQLVQSSGEADAPQKALNAFLQAVKLDAKNPLDKRNPRFLEHLGTVLARVNKLPDARTAFEQAVLLDPNRAFPYQQLASIYTRLGDTAHANAAAKMATEMTFNDQQLRQIQLLSRAHPEDLNLHLILADRYRDLHMRGPARDKYLYVLQLDPKNARAHAAIAAMDAEKPPAPQAH